MTSATEASPIYAKVPQERPDGSAGTGFFMITVDEGWRQSILCTDMYEWSADWLLEVLGRKPFAPRYPR